MAQGIGIAAGHEERLVPGNAGCDSFFKVLSLERVPLHRLDGPLTPEVLQGLELLLIGAPALDLEREEALAVWDWVESGGGLILVLGEEPPRPVFSALLEDVRRQPGPPRDLWSHQLNAPPGLRDLAKHRSWHLHWRRGQGIVSVVASAQLLLAPQLETDAEVSQVCELVSRWRHRAAPAEVARRRKLPQRHRLLQGYPMAHHLRRLTSGDSVDRIYNILDFPQRPCIVGVLPHPFCNPAVKGCGFCTFPQESYRNTTAEQVVAEVAREVSEWPAWKARKDKPVEALYFGGGTANLTPPEPFRALCRATRAALNLVPGAEVTLEGVPIYFTAKKPSLLEVLREELPGLQYRISMGVQTFDDLQLARMGRTAIGGPAAVEKAVRAAKELGFSTSGDLLFNLPGQNRAQMLADVDRAIELGLDQVCVYHLVLFEGLGTEWSKDPAMLAALPPNDAACANWLAVRERLLERGFVQTTLTNFEREQVRGTPHSFRYEPYGFSPERYDIIGFGPAALNVWVNAHWESGLKTANPEGASDYLANRARRRSAERFLGLGAQDMRLLYLTRKVALLGIDRAAYRTLFKADPFEHFGRELTALLEAGLLTEQDQRLSLTPEGMFYGDTVAGTLAWRQVQTMRAQDLLFPRQDNSHELGERLSYDSDVEASIFSSMG